METVFFLKKHLVFLELNLQEFTIEYKEYDPNMQIHIMLILYVYSLIEKLEFNGLLEKLLYGSEKQKYKKKIDTNYIKANKNFIVNICWLSESDIALKQLWDFLKKLYFSMTWKSIILVRNLFTHKSVWNGKYIFSLKPILIHLIYIYLRIIILLGDNKV